MYAKMQNEKKKQQNTSPPIYQPYYQPSMFFNPNFSQPYQPFPTSNAFEPHYAFGYQQDIYHQPYFHMPMQQPVDVKSIENALKNMLHLEDRTEEETKEEIKKDEKHTPKENTPVKQSKKKKKKTPQKSQSPILSFDERPAKLPDEYKKEPNVFLSKDTSARITKQIIKLHKELTPTKKEIEEKKKFFEKVCKAIWWKWKGTLQRHIYIPAFRCKNLHVWIKCK